MLQTARLEEFKMEDIISAAMIAGGDDPSQFVFPSPTTTGSISMAPHTTGQTTP